ncbi:MAG TPA: polysaccharide deacetylase family protein, partial [Nitrososphaeraceae archaeon]|nr:polysaccharide deacetylase family protein [Nitrososphaeraceae archaeon]
MNDDFDHIKSLQSNKIKSTCIIISLIVILFMIMSNLSNDYFFLPNVVATPDKMTGNDNKVVILNFDDSQKSQYTNAKPILDKYGFKATFYVVCTYIGAKQGYMNWQQVGTLHREGHDIASHSMHHIHLDKLPKKDIEFELSASKKCLQDHGINAKSFAYPFDSGSDDKTVINIVAKYYEMARTGNDALAFLRCDNPGIQPSQADCRTYTDKDRLTYANRYTVRAWSQDATRNENSYSDTVMLDKFIKIVNSQTKYNNNGTIRAIPIIAYHRVGETGDIYNTSLKLFEAQMKYLYENDFKVLTMADLAYNDKSNYFFVKEFQPETMTVVKSTPNFTEVPLKGVSTTEVPLKAVSTTGSNATETMVNFTEVPLKGVSTTEVPLKAVSTTGSNATETMV